MAENQARKVVAGDVAKNAHSSEDRTRDPASLNKFDQAQGGIEQRQFAPTGLRFGNFVSRPAQGLDLLKGVLSQARPMTSLGSGVRAPAQIMPELPPRDQLDTR